MPMTLARRDLPTTRDAEMGAASFVPQGDLDAVLRLIAAATKAHPRTGERAGLLIALLFDGCLRVSEAIRLCPKDLLRTSAGGWVATVTGKRGKRYRCPSAPLWWPTCKIIRLPDQAAAGAALLSGVTGPSPSDYAAGV